MILTKEDLQEVAKAVRITLLPEFDRLGKRIDQVEMRVNLLGRTLDDHMEVNATEHQEIKEMIRDLYTRRLSSASNGKYKFA